jgi:hypothetical protein
MLGAGIVVFGGSWKGRQAMEDSNFAFDDILSFGNHLFITLVLVLSAGISSSICHGTGTQKGRETFIVLILLLMAGVQMFHLINAVVYVPATRFYTYNVSQLSLFPLCWWITLLRHHTRLYCIGKTALIVPRVERGPERIEFQPISIPASVRMEITVPPLRQVR